MESLSSIKNPKVQAWRSLKDKKGRDKHKAFLVEGVRMVQEALESRFSIECVLIREGFVSVPVIPPGIPVFLIPDNVFSAICDTKTPQGIAAVLKRQVKTADGPKLVALDGVQDPGNVGTIIRTADAAGFDGIILSSECADLFSPKVLRATMGSIFRLGFSFPESLPDFLKNMKKEGFTILSSQLDGEPFFERPETGSSFVLVIGNEGNGVSDAVKSCADYRLRLPMRGGAESLNAAVAAGIMMYDLALRG